MPRLDKTGPEGEGSLTGRALGGCAELTANEKSERLGTGVGMRRKSGGGNGKGRRLKNDKPR